MCAVCAIPHIARSVAGEFQAQRKLSSGPAESGDRINALTSSSAGIIGACLQ
jgi:hypothetical protein